MPRRESRGHRLPTGGYREHRLAIWGVTGCVAVAAGVALTAGLAAASPHLANIPGDSPDRRPALAGLPTVQATESAEPGPTAKTAPAPSPSARPSSPSPSATPAPSGSAGTPSPPPSLWPHDRTSPPPWHR
jgi:hypothetical protein